MVEHKYLGADKRTFEGFEVLKVGCNRVILTSDEVTALCPVTGQPDFYTVSITIMGGSSIESKSLKLYFQTFRAKGVFCESLAVIIRDDIKAALGGNHNVFVEIKQKPRGGIAIEATA